MGIGEKRTQLVVPEWCTNNKQTVHISTRELQFNSRYTTSQSTLIKFRAITHTKSWKREGGLIGKEGFGQRDRPKEKAMG